MIAKGIVISLLSMMLAFGFGWAQPTPTIYQTTLQEEDAPTPEVSTEELQQILAEGEVLVLDTRPHMEWAVSHIPGALNVAPKPGMAMSQYTSDVAEIGRLVDGDKTRALVLYCNGPFCGKSKRVSEDLLADGYTNVRRYQLGAPVWRALGGVMETELDGARHIYEGDTTAVFVDSRTAQLASVDPLAGAVNIPLEEVEAAKDDLRLPMDDHNTRIVVFGESAEAARAVAEEIAANAFHNVSYFPGEYGELKAALMSVQTAR